MRKPRTKAPGPVTVDLTAHVGEAEIVIIFGVGFEMGFFQTLQLAQEPGEVIGIDVDADGARRIVVRQNGRTRPANSPRGTSGSEFFTAAEWFRFPVPLRERWWEETDYSKKAPGPDLLRAIEEERKSR